MSGGFSKQVHLRQQQFMELLPKVFIYKNIHNCLIVIKQWGMLDYLYQHKSTGQLLISRCSVCCCDGLPLKSLIVDIKRLAKCNSPTSKTGNCDYLTGIWDFNKYTKRELM